jgi:hypothetical protein
MYNAVVGRVVTDVGRNVENHSPQRHSLIYPRRLESLPHCGPRKQKSFGTYIHVSRSVMNEAVRDRLWRHVCKYSATANCIGTMRIYRRSQRCNWSLRSSGITAPRPSMIGDQHSRQRSPIFKGGTPDEDETTMLSLNGSHHPGTQRRYPRRAETPAALVQKETKHTLRN